MFSIRLLAILSISTLVSQSATAETFGWALPFPRPLVVSLDEDEQNDEEDFDSSDIDSVEEEEPLARPELPQMPLPHIREREVVVNIAEGDDDFEVENDGVLPRPRKIPRQVDNTPLFDAAMRGDVEQIQEMAEQTDFEVNARNIFDATALHVAVATNQIQVLKLLLKYGADKTAKNAAGETPFDKALAYGFDEIALLLSE